MSNDQLSTSEQPDANIHLLKSDLIRLINDRCRATFLGCAIVVTAAFTT